MNYKQQLLSNLSRFNQLFAQNKFEQVVGSLSSSMSPFNAYEALTGDIGFKTDVKVRVADGFMSARMALIEAEAPVSETINEAFRSAAHLISVTALAFAAEIERGEFDDQLAE
jgi:hypothetical protein